MAVITSGLHPKALWPGIRAYFGKAYAEKPLVAGMVFDAMTSEKSYEEVQEETGFGLAVQKPEGSGVTYDQDGQGYTTRFTNTVYGLGAVVTREAIEDNQYENVARSKARKLARSMRVTKETVGAAILNRAFNSSYTGGDGKELCATDHPSVAGTYANEPAVAVDFSEAALEDAFTAIRDYTDSRGIRIQARPGKLIVPNELAFEAQRVLGSTLQSGTANNDINAIRAMGMMGVGDIIVWDYLTTAGAWFIKTDVPNGLMLFNRRALALTQDNDFDTENAKMKATERYVFGWADPRGIWGSPGA